ncbi:conserved hypothetical protein [Leadbettera azotonutricia ZAS-9]|uniref:DUF262 domain-containing protein n=2 Tax=Leadbettera azotonutricia TaxID=150829 RepID=F5YEH6_LEAAZ|nr:conserved hypothetical protein [Leadbettera azotonutricia ZAS-9]
MLLFSDKKSDFLIPDYQRPYAWEEEQCQTLWDDIFSFAIPDNNYENFNDNEEYFLGSIVTYKNENDKMEIIDGQQRLTTLMLLLRAFYVKFGKMQDENSKKTREMISQCIWKTNAFGIADVNKLKINSEVATDNDKEEFLEILKNGEVKKEQKSNYAKNFRFFQEKIDQFLSEYPAYFAYLPARILGNCILLPIDAESQDTALRIFSTLNDRGLPLSDADIFKAQFYKFYGEKGEKDSFIVQWKELEEICGEIFYPTTGTPMDELFTRYMYYERAKRDIKSSTTEALRKFYERDKYSLLKRADTFNNLKILANFWQDVSNQNSERFSDKILRKLFTLNYAPNGMWNYFVSVYFMHNKDSNEKLDDNKFENFLTKIIAFIWTYAIVNPGVNALRTPVFAEMLNIVNGKSVEFAGYKFDFNNTKNAFEHYVFSNGRPITKSMLTWWAFTNNEQSLPSAETIFEIEHIFARKRQENHKTLKNEKNLESLGNKALLEKRINIRASDYRFSDKIKYYQGFTNSKGQLKKGTQIKELVKLSEGNIDFTEENIENRNRQIIDNFISFLNENNLIK